MSGGGSPLIEDVFRACYAPLVRALTPALGIDLATEAVQEAFLEAVRRPRQFDQLDNPSAWIRRVAVNRALNRRRSAQRAARAVSRLPAPTAEAPRDRDPDLTRALQALTHRQRLMVGLYYLAELSIDETADLLAVSPGTVKSTLHDCRARLRDLMEVSDERP